jgi:hypothetical protein
MESGAIICQSDEISVQLPVLLQNYQFLFNHPQVISKEKNHGGDASRHEEKQ